MGCFPAKSGAKAASEAWTGVVSDSQSARKKTRRKKKSTSEHGSTELRTTTTVAKRKRKKKKAKSQRSSLSDGRPEVPCDDQDLHKAKPDPLGSSPPSPKDTPETEPLTTRNPLQQPLASQAAPPPKWAPQPSPLKPPGRTDSSMAIGVAASQSPGESTHGAHATPSPSESQGNEEGDGDEEGSKALQKRIRSRKQGASKPLEYEPLSARRIQKINAWIEMLPRKDLPDPAEWFRQQYNDSVTVGSSLNNISMANSQNESVVSPAQEDEGKE